MNTFFYDFTKFKLYGPKNFLECIKKGNPRKAVQALTSGTVESSEGPEHYIKGEWIVTDDQGNPYIVPNEKFIKLYDVKSPNIDGSYNPFPDERRMFRTDKKILINSPQGVLTASPGDWIHMDKDGTYIAPVKTAAMNSAYKLKNTVYNILKING